MPGIVRPAALEHTEVLIVAPISDVHALAVARQVEDLGRRVLILDVAYYLLAWRLAVAWTAGRRSTVVHDLKTGKAYSLSNLCGVWYRRFWPLRCAETISDRELQSFTYMECRDFLHGTIALSANIINNPASEWAANRKVLQLETARRAGLRIPETLMTTDAVEVRAFEQEHGPLIFKCFTNTDFQFTETRRLGPEEWQHADAMHVAPTIFQRRIVGRRHLRCTYVDGAIFTAQITTDDPAADCDWRLDIRHRVEPGIVDRLTTDGIHALMSALDLRYGALDFIESTSGDLYFLEVNPSGQYLFCEMHANLAISESIARALVGTTRTLAGA